MSEVIVVTSGKGGVGYVLKSNYGIDLPRRMKEDMGYKAKKVSDVLHKELRADELYRIFEDNFLRNRSKFDIRECHFRQVNGIEAIVTIFSDGAEHVVRANGNGRLDAVSNALKKFFSVNYLLTGYEQHALSDSSSAKAISYVGVESGGSAFWGAGIDDDIIKSSYKALVSAVNNLLA